MYPYEHLMQKHLLYEYPTLGILLVLPPWVMSFLQPLGFIYHGRTNLISWSVTAPQSYGRAQLPLLSQQPRQISDRRSAGRSAPASRVCSSSVCPFCCSNTAKKQWRSPKSHGNICISDPCQTSLRSKLRWALWNYDTMLWVSSHLAVPGEVLPGLLSMIQSHFHKLLQPRKMPGCISAVA